MKTEAQLRKQAYNMRCYDRHAEQRPKNAREYYYKNREAVLAYKKAWYAEKAERKLYDELHQKRMQDLEVA